MVELRQQQANQIGIPTGFHQSAQGWPPSLRFNAVTDINVYPERTCIGGGGSHACSSGPDMSLASPNSFPDLNSRWTVAGRRPTVGL